MESSLAILARAFYESGPRIAVFDAAARERAGLWHLDGHAVPTEEVLAILRECPAFRSGERLLVPLHELDSAELTGQYLVSTLDRRPNHVGFFDYAEDTVVFYPTDVFGSTAPALHVRYWHPDYWPPETPSYLQEHFDYEEEVDRQPSVSPDDDGSIDDSFFEEVKLDVEREREAEREANRERHLAGRGTSSIDKLGGVARLEPGGRRIDDEGSQICSLELPEETSDGADRIDVPETYGVYPGSEVLVDVVGGAPGYPVDAEVAAIDGRRIDLWLKWSTSDDHAGAEPALDPDSGHTFRLAKLLNPVPYDRQRAGVEAVEADGRKRDVVLGERTLEFDEEQSIGSASRQLNQYQRRAIRRSLGASDVFCIHGPPGTGKTRTLVSLIREAVDRGEKVLACAHSNQAVDNLLVGSSTLDEPDSHSLHAAAMDDEFALGRAGEHSDHPVVSEYYTDFENWEVNVVGATTSAANRFRDDEFDLVVVDEAAQCGVASTMIPYSRGERLVLAGDHQQLPPYTSNEREDEEQMDVSLFEHVLSVYGDEVSTLLRKQYRMNQEIAAFPNEAFYGGRLTHGQRNRDWTIGDLDPLVGIQVDGEERETPGGSYYNEAEAAAVTGEVARLRENGVPASRIGVITPYSGQVGKIVQAFDDQNLAERVDVDTVDSFQGGEREAIVVSFVRSNDRGNTGFLTFPNEGPRRLNVALTRARKRCTLIGDWETLRRTPDHRSADEDASHVFDALFGHLEENGCLMQVASPVE